MQPASSLRQTTTAAAALVVAVCLGTGGCSPTTGSSGGSSPDTAVAEPTPSASTSPQPMPTFDPTSVVGDYAPSFPVDLLAAPEDTTILASSAVPREDDTVEISLNLATTLDADDVVSRYAERLEDAGFSESDSEPLSASALTSYTAYSRTKGKKNPRFESVHLGVLDDGERRLVTISGIVRSPDGA